jgi:ectoine hydroxylase-related dioxygenase (phytanoyl-CoA dioxygenase family)
MIDKPDMLDYLFDLRGYIVLEQALSMAEVDRLNAALDAIPPLTNGEWFGNVQGHTYRDHADGRNLQNIVEGGLPFEELIDHPGWIERVRKYVGAQDGLFIDECFATLRGPSEFISIHSGGHKGRIRTQYAYKDNSWHCGQINVLMALTDIGPGDGPTVVIPGSHKSYLMHPGLDRDPAVIRVEPPELMEGAVPAYLKCGDVLLFVDSICHGGSARINPGLRRTVIFRYGPEWGAPRYGHAYSDELIARLTPERAEILRPKSLRPRNPKSS